MAPSKLRPKVVMDHSCFIAWRKGLLSGKRRMQQQSHRRNSLETRRQLCSVLLGLLLMLLGCSPGTTRKGALIKSSKNIESSAAELSSRNQSLLGLYSSEIENAADKIILESRSPLTRRQALEWKVEAIPILQTSLLRTDPVGAVLDAWAFTWQMKDYMQQPAVKPVWGEFYPVVAQTLDGMQNELEKLIQAAAPSANIDAARERVEAWAKANPIRGGLAGRRSADADLIRKTEQSDLGTRASIKALEESIGDLTARLDAYNAFLPKQARWQAELLLSDLSRDPQINHAMTNAALLSDALTRTTGRLDRMPETIEQLRKEALADVESQRLAVQAFLREERVQAMDALSQERIATIADLRGERLAATADLRGEREIVLNALHNEQTAVMSALKVATDKALLDFDARARG